MYEVIPYSQELDAAWEDFCVEAWNSTFIHTRRFLSYHGSRFRDASLVLKRRGKIVGLLPAAFCKERSDVVQSHPGATFGGMVHQGRLLGTEMLLALEACTEHFAGLGASRFIYRPVPAGYAKVLMQDDLYAMHALGASLSSCQLSSIIDLGARRRVSDRRARAARRGKAETVVRMDPRGLESFWPVLERVLQDKFGATPVHSHAEMALLLRRFPRHISLVTAEIKGSVEAGVVIFRLGESWHCQYIASSPVGHSESALDLVVEYAIGQAKSQGARFFDFGTSNGTPDGSLNQSLYKFKSEFGGFGMVHDCFELEL